MSSLVQGPLSHLFHRRPDLAPTLLSGLGVRMPRHSVVRTVPADPTSAASCRADVVLQLQWVPVLGIVVELPRSIQEDRSHWSKHLASLRQREQCVVELLVVTRDQAVTTWAHQPLLVNERKLLPRVLHVPPVLNEKRALRDHQQAMLSAVAHADDPDESRALRIAHLAQKSILKAVSEEEAGWYLGLIRECFPASRREKLITPIICPYDRERSKLHFTLGVANALLGALVRRHGALPPGVTEHVLTLSLDELAALRHRLPMTQTLDEALAVPAASLGHKQGTAAHLIEELARAHRQPCERRRGWRWVWGWR